MTIKLVIDPDAPPAWAEKLNPSAWVTTKLLGSTTPATLIKAKLPTLAAALWRMLVDPMLKSVLALKGTPSAPIPVATFKVPVWVMLPSALATTLSVLPERKDKSLAAGKIAERDIIATWGWVVTVTPVTEIRTHSLVVPPTSFASQSLSGSVQEIVPSALSLFVVSVNPETAAQSPAAVEKYSTAKTGVPE